MSEFTVERTRPATFDAPDTSQVGFGVCALQPAPGIAMAGRSTEGRRAKGESRPLMVRAMCVEDEHGRRAALCVADLMSASRYLHEKAASLLARRVGITRENLILVGTHTHNAPGHFYGASLYDQLAQPRRGFDRCVADAMVARIVDAVVEGFDSLCPAELGLAEGHVWGLTHNASLEAFEANPSAAGWRAAMACPEDTPAAFAAVDPRLTVLAAVGPDRRVMGTLALFAGHNTALSPAHPDYDPDWYGVACDVVAADHGHALLAPGAGSDLNVLREEIPAGPGLAAHVGTSLARHWLELVESARIAAAPFEVDVRFGVADREQARVDNRPDTELAPHFVFGAPTLAGPEDGRSILYSLGLCRAGTTSGHYAADHPQHPKARVLGPLQDVLRTWQDLDISPELPLHVLRLGELTLATLPGEPTVMMGQQVEQALRSVGGHTRVVGYAGDYAGYLTTDEEFRAQHYEGASTLLGRNTARHLVARLRHIAEQPRSPPAGGVATFRTWVRSK